MIKTKLLKQYFGHEEFRAGQEQIIDCVLSGRDCIGIMPTGAGKSVCYQLPALMSDGITLVISPLVSLMKDQVDALKENGIPAAFINSSLTISQIDAVLRKAADGGYKLIYVAPERLDSAAFLSFFDCRKNIYGYGGQGALRIAMGQDFRPGYRRIAEFVEKLPRRKAFLHL